MSNWKKHGGNRGRKAQRNTKREWPKIEALKQRLQLRKRRSSRPKARRPSRRARLEWSASRPSSCHALIHTGDQSRGGYRRRCACIGGYLTRRSSRLTTCIQCHWCIASHHARTTLDSGAIRRLWFWWRWRRLLRCWRVNCLTGEH